MIDPDTLRTLMIDQQVTPITFAGHRLLLDANGVLIWPQKSLIVFSDLHLEKGSFLTQFAHPLPLLDSKDTLARMNQMLRRYKCQHVVCLGDSLHDKNATSRMQNNDLADLNMLVNSVKKWTWVLGNHDPSIPDIIGGERTIFVKILNLLFVHEPEAIDKMREIDAQVIGHFHPKSSHRIANRRLSGKSFVSTNKMLIMPAFGRYTGGLDIKDKAYSSLFSRESASVYLTYNHKIYVM